MAPCPVLLWRWGTLPTQGGPWEEQPWRLVQGLREFYVQLILFTCKIWVSARFLGCLPHRQFAAGLQRQVDVCYPHRFYPNPCQRVRRSLPCVRAGLSLTLRSCGQMCLRRCETVVDKDEAKKTQLTPSGCLRQALRLLKMCQRVSPQTEKTLLMELITINDLSLPLFID